MSGMQVLFHHESVVGSGWCRAREGWRAWLDHSNKQQGYSPYYKRIISDDGEYPYNPRCYIRFSECLI